MYFNSFSDFIQMGNHGFYVWTAYGIGLTVLCVLILLPLRKNKRFIEEQKRQMRRQQNSDIK